MIERKYRIWDKKNKVMIGWGATRKFPFFTLEENEDYQALQFTGFLDKHGNEIYEGDVLKEFQGIIYEVEWFDGGWGIKSIFNYYTLWSSQSYEIIGNIYENPDLLEEKS